VTASERLAALLAGAAPAQGLMGWRGGEPVAWQDFLESARRWQAGFQALAGTRVALHFADGIDFSAALFGAWQAGKQVWLPGELTPAMQAALQQRVDAWAGDAGMAVELPRVLPADPTAAVATRPLDRDAEALVVFTSGSTGSPEAVPKRLRQLFDEIDGLQAAFGAHGSGTVVASVSAQHVYGLLFRVLWPLGTGRALQARSLVYLEDLDELLPAGARGVLVASPTHLARLPLVAPAAASRLDAVFSSGAPLPDAALPEALRVFGRAPIEVYGSTETGGVAWRQRDPGAPDAWQPLPGVQWRLEDEQLALRSPHLPTSEWTLSADRVVAVEGGFALRGRADRIVKIAEKRVSLQAVEDGLLTEGLLSVVRPVPLDDGRTQLGIVAVPTAAGWALHDLHGRRALADRLRAQLLGVVERVALPRRWRFLPELPRNAQGKATQARLQAEFDPRRPALRALVREGDHAELTLLVDAALPQFDGHFPGHPVLPGVAQLDWAARFARELFDIAAPFDGMEALKFQRVIVPGRRLTLTLDWQPPGRLAFRYHSDDGPHASGRLLFAGEVA
jgi:acyl-coenzyme A synthetase/AMP-(fatty) acid ligase